MFNKPFLEIPTSDLICLVKGITVMRVATRQFSSTVQLRMAPSEEQLDSVSWPMIGPMVQGQGPITGQQLPVEVGMAIQIVLHPPDIPHWLIVLALPWLYYLSLFVFFYAPIIF